MRAKASGAANAIERSAAAAGRPAPAVSHVGVICRQVLRVRLTMFVHLTMRSNFDEHGWITWQFVPLAEQHRRRAPVGIAPLGCRGLGPKGPQLAAAPGVLAQEPRLEIIQVTMGGLPVLVAKSLLPSQQAKAHVHRRSITPLCKVASSCLRTPCPRAAHPAAGLQRTDENKEHAH